MRRVVQQNTFVGSLDTRHLIAKEFESIAKVISQKLDHQNTNQTLIHKSRRKLLKRAA
jgi:hypothetical protein